MRWIEDGRAEERSVDAAVGNGEDTALQVLDGDGAVAGFFRVEGEVLLEFGERLAVGIADDRNNESAFRADGDTDVIKVVLHQFLAIEARVDLGLALEGVDHRFDEKRHEAELDAVFGGEGFLDVGAKLHDGRHVAFVECGEDGGVALGGNELGGNLFAQRGKLFPGDAAFLGFEFDGR